VLGRTFAIASAVTVLCLLLGYPLAYVLATLARPHRQRADGAGAAAVLDLAAGAHLAVDRAAAARGGVINSALLQGGFIDARWRCCTGAPPVYTPMTHVLLRSWCCRCTR